MDTTILVIIITRKAEFRNLHRRFEELNYGIFSGLPLFAPNNTTKALLLQRKPYCQNESRAIVLLCTRREKWVHFLYVIFQLDFIPGTVAKEVLLHYSYSRVHLPFCIRILQEHKEKDWNLVSKYQSFYGGGEGNRTPVRRPNYRIFSERRTHFGFPLPQRLRTGYGAW